MSRNHYYALVLSGVLAVLMTACGGDGIGGVSGSTPTAGSLDTAFGTNGKVITDLGGGAADSASAMAIQSDGKIVVVGLGYLGGSHSDDFGVTRYNTDGTLDTSFGSGGKVLTDFVSNTDHAYGVAIQPSDQKIVVVGSVASGGNFSFGIARYNIDGSPDNTFGVIGKVITDMSPGFTSEARGVAIQDDGKIVVVGSAGSDPHFAVARYLTTGVLDNLFDTDGMLLTDVDNLANGGLTNQSYAYGVAIQPSDQKIVVVGGTQNFGHPQMALVRYNTNGSLDTNFNHHGIVSDGIVVNQIENRAEAHAVAIQGDGKILAAGYCNMLAAPYPNQFALLRYTSDGSLDTTFSTDGVVTTAIGSLDDQAQALAIQSDGKIVAVGYSNNGSHNNFALVRYASNGSLDTAFGSSGKMAVAMGSGDSQAFGIGIQSDHKIVVAGTAVGVGTDTDFSLIRVWP